MEDACRAGRSCVVLRTFCLGQPGAWRSRSVAGPLLPASHTVGFLQPSTSRPNAIQPVSRLCIKTQLPGGEGGALGLQCKVLCLSS